MAEPTRARAGWAVGPIAWMASNPVAANLAMVVLMLGGLLSLLSMKQEIFPEFELDVIQIEVPYPGASPAEVEQGVVLAIEEAVRAVDGVKRVDTIAYEGRATASLELQLGVNPDKVLNDVKSAIDRITTFPEESEQPRVSLVARQSIVVSLIVAGDQPLSTLHGIAERIRADLLRDPGITKVEIVGVPPPEIAVEIPQQELERYGLTLDQVAAQIRNTSVERPGGGVKTPQGEILVRTTERRRQGHQLEDVVIRSGRAGAQVALSELAEIIDDYEDQDLELYYDGRRAVRVTVYRVGTETPKSVAKIVHAYHRQLVQELPENLEVAVWDDDSELLQGRIDLLVRNAATGLLLVIVILALFLELRLALWVALGIPICFLGSFLFLGSTSLSINMVSLFAFIVTLGMVVDDAIVVGEHTYSKVEAGMPPLEAASRAAREMAMPVTFAILTTVAAFAPMFFVPGVTGKIFGQIPLIVITVLMLSLFESFFVLPAHLGHSRRAREPGLWGTGLRAVQGLVARGLAGLTRVVYVPAMRGLMGARYLVVSVAVVAVLLSFAWVGSGRVPFNFFPLVEGDVVSVAARLPYGVDLAQTKAVQRELERAALAAQAELGEPGLIKATLTSVGQDIPRGGASAGPPERGSHIVAIEVELGPAEGRRASSAEFSDAWKRHTPTLAAVESISFTSSLGVNAGAAVDVQISHADQRVLERASSELAELLAGFPSLINVRNQFAAGKPQLDFELTPEATSLGVDSAALARALRGSFFGAEALREQRARDELKIMVRLPRAQRSSEHDLERVLVQTPAGGLVPIVELAEIRRSRAPTTIQREDAQRKVNVTAELAVGVRSAQPVLDELRGRIFPALTEKYPGISLALAGSQRSQAETFGSLRVNTVLAFFVIYALLAIPFRSYVQPLIVMSVIPFGLVGAIWGHVYMGLELSIMSVLGMVALSGVVINDSLVLIDATNRVRPAAGSAIQAVLEAGASRMRPILLTSLTTFFGLMPMIAERSVQARFLVPMAVSLGFGVMFVTIIVLVLVPMLYVIVDDVVWATERLAAIFGAERPVAPAPEAGPTERSSGSDPAPGAEGR